MTIQEQVEGHMRELEDKDLNKLALSLNHPNARKGIQAPLGVTVTQQQRENFILWVKQTGNVDNAGIYLGILPDPNLSERERTSERQRKLDQSAIDQAKAAKSQVKIAWIALFISVAALLISIIALWRK